MTFEDALQSMREGKVINRESYYGDFIGFFMTKRFDKIIIAEHWSGDGTWLEGDMADFDGEEIMADDWEIIS